MQIRAMKDVVNVLHYKQPVYSHDIDHDLARATQHHQSVLVLSEEHILVSQHVNASL